MASSPRHDRFLGRNSDQREGHTWSEKDNLYGSRRGRQEYIPQEYGQRGRSVVDTYRPRSPERSPYHSPNDRRRMRDDYSSPVTNSRYGDSGSPNMRHTFRRERRSPSFSPPRAYIDHYEPRRSSPIRRRSRSVGRQRRSHVSPEHPPRSNDNHIQQTIAPSSMTWVNPAMSKTKSPISFKGAAARAKVEVNGVKNVPTGPSQPLFPPVGREVLCLPHIFIPRESVPVSHATTPHLVKKLRHEDIHLDETGYYVTFPKESLGTIKLASLYKKHNATPFFGKHQLDMVQFPTGRPDVPTNTNINKVPSGPNSIMSTLDRPAEPLDALPSDSARSDNNENGLETSSITTTQAKQARVVAGADYGPSLPTQGFLRRARPLRATSPLRTASCQSRDDTASSTSGRTASDVAGSKTPKCHVCKLGNEVNSIWQCSTCSRRYHRHCKSPVHQAEGCEGQCPPCVKKLREPIRKTPATLEVHSNALRVGNGLSTSIENSPPTKPTDQEPSKSTAISAHSGQRDQPSLGSAMDTVTSGAISEASHADSEVKKGQTSAESKKQPSELPSSEVKKGLTSAESNKQPIELPSDDPHFSEVHSLVEKSFDEGASSYEAAKKKPAKPCIFKRKSLVSPISEEVVPRPVSSIPSHPQSKDVALQAKSGGEQNKTEMAESINATVQPQSLGNSITSAYPLNKISRAGRRNETKLMWCEVCKDKRTPLNPLGKSICSGCKKKIKEVEETPKATEDADEELGVSHSLNNDANLTAPLELTTVPDDSGEAAQPGHQAASHHPTNQQAEQAGPEEQAPDEEDRSTVKGHNPQLQDTLPSDLEEGHVEPRETSLPTLTTPKRKRTSHRKVPDDENDLGNSYVRPKGTYLRLYTMALYDAPGNRLQSSAAVKWIAENIPGYQLGAGNWAAGIQSTMIMNAKNASGKPIAGRVQIGEGDKNIWYEMLPGIKDQLEHWDHVLQRPIPPRNTLSQSSTTSLNASQGSSAQQRGNLQSPVKGAASSPKKSARKSSSNYDAMDVDVDARISGVHDSLTSEEGSPVKKKRKRLSPTKATEGHASKSPQQSAVVSTTGLETVDCGRKSAATLLAPTVEKSVPRHSVQDQKPVDISEKSLSKAWPRWYAQNTFDREAKIAEVKARKTRKQLFRKNTLQSRLGDRTSLDLRPPVYGSHVTLQTSSGNGSDHVDPGDPTLFDICDNLDKFFGITSDLIPIIHQGKLAFRDSDTKRRGIFKTGL